MEVQPDRLLWPSLNGKDVEVPFLSGDGSCVARENKDGLSVDLCDQVADFGLDQFLAVGYKWMVDERPQGKPCLVNC